MVTRPGGYRESNRRNTLHSKRFGQRASPADMSDFFYMHGFNELDLAVRDLLRIVESLQGRRAVDKPVV